MKDENKSKSQLIDELREMRKRVAALERNNTVEDPVEKVRDEALRKNEERLRLALEGTADGIWDWDPGTGQAYFSPRYYTMMGYEPDEFPPTYESWRQLLHPDDVEAVEEAVQRALEEHTPFAIEFRFKAKNGDWRWILSRGKIAELDAEGTATRVVGSHTDITDRKRMAEALEKRIVALTQPLEDVESIAFEDLFNLSDIQRLQDLYAEAFGVAALITHPDGTPITQPSNFTVLCGEIIRNTRKGLKNCRHSDAMVGRHNPKGPNIQACLSAGLCNAGASITVGGRHIANWLIGQVRYANQKEEDIIPYAREIGADETAFRTAYRQVPTMSREQFEKVAQVLFTVANQLSMSAFQNVQQARFITQRKQDGKELRRLRNYLSNIINSMPSLLVAVDRDGNVTQWNNQTEQATGMSFKEAQARPLVEVFPGLADEMGHIRTAIRERRVIVSPKVSRKMARETRFEDITIYPLVANGVEGAVIRVDDVTEQMRIEEMMIQSEKMLTVGGLAAGMAHEINNPLAGMLQTAGVMANRLGSELNIPANQQAAEAAGTTMAAIEQFMIARGIPRMIESITTSGRRVADVVKNMLRFARKDDAMVSFQHLEEIIDKTLELAGTDYDLKKQYDFKRIEIVKEYAVNVPAVPCQESKIQQVLLNILSNGAQAMQTSETENPRFILRTYVDSGRNMVCMEIEDNGPGMDEPTRKRIFEPFFTTKPQGVGTGLGLSISYFIITKNHRGEISVASSPGTGAKFVISLPPY